MQNRKKKPRSDNYLVVKLPHMTFALTSERGDWYGFIKKKYTQFLEKNSKKKPNFLVELIPSNRKSVQMNKARGNRFRLRFPDNKRGFWKIDAYIRMALGRYSLENALGLMIHSSALVKGGMAHIFSGPSGKGKTTLLKNSSQYRPLNDDYSIIFSKGSNFFVAGSPFHESYKIERTRKSFPLHSVYFIYHSPTDSIKNLSPEQFQKNLMLNLLSHRSSNKKKNRELLQNAIQLCYALTNAVPGYSLGVKKGDTFWQKIDEEKRKDLQN